MANGADGARALARDRMKVGRRAVMRLTAAVERKGLSGPGKAARPFPPRAAREDAAQARQWREYGGRNAGAKWSFFENGMPGLHLTINPQKPPARVVQKFAEHGITVSDRERQSILLGCSEGVGAVKTVLDTAIPGFAPAARLKFANQIVDALARQGPSGQLSREAPA